MRETIVLAHVMSAARKVVVEQLQPKGAVRSSQRSCQGMGQMCALWIGESRCPCLGRGTHVED